MKSVVLSLLALLSSASKLLKMDRAILKDGLHRELRTNLSYTLEGDQEYDKCSFVIRESISKDVYIYLEEVLALKNFEFFPTNEPMDIEKPASTAKEYEFIWRVPFNGDNEKYKTWIKNYQRKEG